MTELRASKDLEDVVFVLNYRAAAYEEIQKAEDNVRGYLRKSFQELLSEASINEAIAAVLDFGKSKETHDRVMPLIRLVGSPDQA